MNKETLQILKCPVTGKNLRIADKKEISGLHQKFTSALCTTDGKYIYPIIDGILCLSKDLAILRDKQTPGKKLLNNESLRVRKFYDEIGWKKNGKYYDDAVKFEDLRRVSREYIHKCHMRVKKYLNREGNYILDAGSGPIQYSDYLEYSRHFKKRVCVDISFLALKEAKKKLGAKGIYVLADLTNLPFQVNVFDATVSMHVIYHIPKMQQPQAFSEIYRTLKSGSCAVVVYSWPTGFNLLNFGGLVLRKFGLRKTVTTPGLFYFQPQTFEYLKKSVSFSIAAFPWRSVSVDFLKVYIHEKFCGRQILRLIYHLENLFPGFIGMHGRYPLLVISKP